MIKDSKNFRYAHIYVWNIRGLKDASEVALKNGYNLFFHL